jgi:ABC-type branched-subunit amino acid transport system substrate-binding protein
MLKRICVLMSLLVLVSCSQTTQNLSETPGSFKKEKIASDRLEVALLLPLTGENSDIGRNMLDATQLALVELKAEQVNIEPIDTGSNLDRTNDLLENLEAKKYDLIIGPVFSNHTKLVYNNYAYKNNIPMISFSNDVSLLNHKGLYLIGFMPDQQIERVVRYASSHGYDKTVALIPNNRYGKLVENILREKALNHELVGVNRYNFTANGGNTVNAALEEVKESMLRYPLQADGKPVKFALLAPEGNAIMKEVAEDMKIWAQEKNISFKLLGSSQWDNEDLIHSTQINGTWIASAPVADVRGFERRFYQNFGYNPFKISVIAYDAIALSAVLGLEKTVAANMLLDPSGFKGISGVFRFRKDGSNERGLSIFEIENGKLIEIDHAPEAFGAISN